MNISPLPLGSPLKEYEQQATKLLACWQADDDAAVQLFHTNHPRFLDERILWLPKNLSREELRAAPIDLADARLALARWYSFQDWSRLVDWVEAVADQDSPVAKFESAVEAVVNGDVVQLKRLLQENPELVRARSTIVTHHDPPLHAATLLHYVAANGVENHRQRTPANAVEIAKLLLDSGSEVDALAGFYGGQCTTMSLLVSSCHPAEAGVQVPLVDTLLDYGAAVDSRGTGESYSPLMTALTFGYSDTAEALARRGAPIDNLAAAAGLGRLEDFQRFLPSADAEDRHKALALAATHGHVEIVRLLLDAGEDPNRYNPEGFHRHSTPLHQAVFAGHLAIVKLLIERGARQDLKDMIHQSTPLGWAEHCQQREIAEYLRTRP